MYMAVNIYTKQDQVSGNFNYEQYLWNEIILNFSRQNLEYG